MKLAASHNDLILPTLRPDLEILPGPTEHDGRPAYIIHDPLHANFEKVSWAQMQIIRFLRHPITLDRLMKQLEYTTLKVSVDEVRTLCADLIQRGLTHASGVRPVQQLMEQKHRSLYQQVMNVIRHYFYFRLPLIHPDTFLDQTVRFASILVSPVMITLYLAAALLGLIILMQRFEQYIHTFTCFFNFSGMLQYVLAIVAVKTVHEFSHAYTAKAMGTRVPAMGIAFILLWPVPYSDVTDAWRLRSRKQRLIISLAGVIAESVIAAIALCLWAFAPTGVLKSICFVVSSVTLAATLLVNLNPAMRYDGYYVLSDLMGVDNLQQRAFSLAKWFFRKSLLGLDLPPPERITSTTRFAGMILYAVYAWIYRTLLYIAIALFVYYAFTKVLGVMMLAVEVWFFFIQPVVNEAAYLAKQFRKLSLNPKSGTTLVLVLILLLYLALPLPHRQSIPAVTMPAVVQQIYITQPGRVRTVNAELDDDVSQGQLLLELRSRQQEAEREITRLEIDILRNQLTRLANDELGKAFIPQKREELEQAGSKYAELQQAHENLRIHTAITGTIVDWDNSIEPGMFLPKGSHVGTVADAGRHNAVAYLPEKWLNHVHIGKNVSCRLLYPAPAYNGTITGIKPVPAEYLEHRQLASAIGGPIPVRPQPHSDRLEIVGNYYQIEIQLQYEQHDDTLSPTQPATRLGQPATIYFYSRPQSLIINFFQYLHKTLIRESSF